MLKARYPARYLYLFAGIVMLVALAIIDFPPFVVVLFALQFAMLVYSLERDIRNRSDADRSEGL